MSPRERELRSELKQLLLSMGLVRGNLSVRERTCGKASCHCMRGGAKHTAVYLVASEGGKLRQLFIPRALEPQAREWAEAYQRLRALLEELSELHWQKLQQRKA
jgi:hypothetical protein